MLRYLLLITLCLSPLIGQEPPQNPVTNPEDQTDALAIPLDSSEGEEELEKKPKYFRN